MQLTIKVTDVNDNAPRFELPDYQAHNVDEDVAVGTSILQGKDIDYHFINKNNIYNTLFISTQIF